MVWTEKQKKWIKNNPDKVKKYQKKWRKAHLSYFTNWQKKKSIELRKKIYTILGDKCIRCGYSDKRALQIDHKNGKGNIHNKKWHGGLSLLKYVLKHPNEFQILCANCNWIKRAEDCKKMETIL